MKRRIRDWLFRGGNRWSHLHAVPMRQLWILLTAVFLLFSVIGFYTDLIGGGRVPVVDTLVLAFTSGANAVLWVYALSRLPRIALFALIPTQFFLNLVNHFFLRGLHLFVHPQPMEAKSGINFAATCILAATVLSYGFFVRFMAATGRDAMRIRSELELAQGIQKTLVPPVACVMAHFEMYGVSHPSDKVGGDLVDVVELPGGDCVAYLADIAGHGLQAGILMGMLKTAARTALTDGRQSESGANGTSADGTILALLMERLNTVLPQVKEPHMYATFTALRLNRDGRAFYGMAASPPLLHWKAGEGRMQPIEEEQFPLGLLPVSGFAAHPLEMQPGDIAVIATDGILEVRAKKQRGKAGAAQGEFGAASLGEVIGANAGMPLAELAGRILDSVRSFGAQFDDQTLLLVRRVR